MKHANAGQFLLAASATALAAGLSWAGYKAVAPKVSLPKGGPAPGAGSSPNNPLPVPSSDAAAKRIPKVAERLKRLWGEATGETEPLPPAALELMLAQIYLESGVAEPSGGDWWQDRSDPNGAWAKKNPDKALQGNMKGSGNLGAMQCASCSESKPHYTCVQYSDTSPKSDGTSTTYSVCFKYFRDAEGRPAGDWAALEYMRTLKRRLVDLAPLKNGNAYEYAEALRKGKYYEGFGATQENRIKGYAKGMVSHLPAVAAALGHDRIFTTIDPSLLPGAKVAGIEGAGTIAAIAASAVAATGAIAWGVSKSIEASAAKDEMARHMAEMRAAEASKRATSAVVAPPATKIAIDPSAAQTAKAISETVMTIANLAKGAEPPRPMYDVRGAEVGSAAGTVAVVAASAGTLAAAAYAAKAVADAAKEAPGKIADALNPLATVDAPKNPSAEHGPKGEPVKGRERVVAPNVDPVPDEPPTLLDKAYEMSPLAAIRRALGGAEQLQALHLAGALPRARMVPVTGELIWYIEKPAAPSAASVDGCCGSAESSAIGPPDKVPVRASDGSVQYVTPEEAKAAGATQYADGSWNLTTAAPIDKPSDGPGEPIHMPPVEVGTIMDPDDALMKFHGLTPEEALAQGWTRVEMPAGCSDCSKPGWRSPVGVSGTLATAATVASIAAGAAAVAQAVSEVYSTKHQVRQIKHELAKDGVVDPKAAKDPAKKPIAGVVVGSLYDVDAHAQRAKDDLANLLGHPTWLRGIGIGTKDGQPAILVNVRTHDDAKSREIPSSVRMIPVMVRAVGDIVPHAIGATQDDIFSMIDAAATQFSNAWIPGSGDAFSTITRTAKGAIDRATGHDPGRAIIAPSLAQQAKAQEAEVNAAVAAQLERQAKAQEALAKADAAREAKAAKCAPAKRVVREWVARHPILTRALSPDLRVAAADPCADGGADIQAFVQANPFTVAHTSPDLREIVGMSEKPKKDSLVKVKKGENGRMRKDIGSSATSSEPQASGLMLRAIRAGTQAPVRWATILLDGDIEVEVMGDAMAAETDGFMLRLPVSYSETITAAQLLGRGTLIPFSKRIADAVYQQSARLVFHGLVSTAADSMHMRSLDFVKRFNDDINAQIEKKDSAGRLIFGPWKLWILSSKLGVKAKDSPTEPAAINYGGWRANGTPVQTEGTHHTYGHDDYSQLLQLAKRWGTRRSTGERADLLDWIEQNEGVGHQYTEPFRG